MDHLYSTCHNNKKGCLNESIMHRSKKKCIYIMPVHTLKKSLYIYLKSRLKMLIQWEYI